MVLPGGSINVAMFSTNGIAPTIDLAGPEIVSGTLDGRVGSRRRGQMADLNATAANER